jgi:hypothetical protein
VYFAYNTPIYRSSLNFDSRIWKTAVSFIRNCLLSLSDSRVKEAVTIFIYTETPMYKIKINKPTCV